MLAKRLLAMYFCIAFSFHAVPPLIMLRESCSDSHARPVQHHAMLCVIHLDHSIHESNANSKFPEI